MKNMLFSNDQMTFLSKFAKIRGSIISTLYRAISFSNQNMHSLAHINIRADADGDNPLDQDPAQPGQVQVPFDMMKAIKEKPIPNSLPPLPITPEELLGYDFGKQYSSKIDSETLKRYRDELQAGERITIQWHPEREEQDKAVRKIFVKPVQWEIYKNHEGQLVYESDQWHVVYTIDGESRESVGTFTNRKTGKSMTYEPGKSFTPETPKPSGAPATPENQKLARTQERPIVSREQLDSLSERETTLPELPGDPPLQTPPPPQPVTPAGSMRRNTRQKARIALGAAAGAALAIFGAKALIPSADGKGQSATDPQASMVASTSSANIQKTKEEDQSNPVVIKKTEQNAQAFQSELSRKSPELYNVMYGTGTIVSDGHGLGSQIFRIFLQGATQDERDEIIALRDSFQRSSGLEASTSKEKMSASELFSVKANMGSIPSKEKFVPALHNEKDFNQAVADYSTFKAELKKYNTHRKDNPHHTYAGEKINIAKLSIVRQLVQKYEFRSIG